MRPRTRRVAPLALSLALLAAAARADVVIVGQPGSYATIQAAVDAAVDGDVLRIGMGVYAPFTIQDKTLTLLDSGTGPVDIQGLSFVRDLAPQRSVVLEGLRFFLNDDPSDKAALQLIDDLGHVRIANCNFWCKKTFNSGFPPKPGSHGLKATNCAQVVVVDSSLYGASFGFLSGLPGHRAGDGLHSINSSVVLYDCVLRGGEGSGEGSRKGGEGGAGARVNGLGLFASGCEFVGGLGGGGDFLGCTDSGDGGDGVTLTGGQLIHLDSLFTPGQPGNFWTCNSGVDGLPISNSGGTVVPLSGTARVLTGPDSATDKSQVPYVVTGQPGDAVWLFRSRVPTLAFVPWMNGVLALVLPSKQTVAPAGIIGAGGTLALQLAIGDLVGPQAGWTLTVQGLCVDTLGDVTLTTPLPLFVLDT